MNKQEQLADIKKKRADKLAAYDAAVKETRIDSEIKLGEIEESTGRTLGINLAVVFLPDGRFIAVKKAPAVVYNKISTATSNRNLTEELQSEFSAVAVEYPTAVEAENMYLDFPNARDAVINAASLLVAVDQSNLLGK